MRSLRSRLLVAWVLSLAAALAVGGVLVQLYRQTSAAHSGLGAAVLEQACAAVADSYAYYVAGWSGARDAAEEAAFRRDLAAVAGLAMTGRPGLAGGIWRADGEGGEALANPPDAALAPLVAAAAREAAGEDGPAAFGTADGRLGLACALGGPVPGVVAWVASRVGPPPGLRVVQVGLGVLLALVLATAGWLSAALVAWQRRIGGIEAALAGHARARIADAGAALPHLAPTGERELDRIVDALNAAGARLAVEQGRAAALAARVAAGERLAALGRVAAGVAHEIRNPIAAMRLRAENALAGDASRQQAALAAILGQIDRLERLTGELLAMTQRRQPAPAATDVAALLAACAAEHGGRAARIAVAAPALRGMLDGGLVRRILDNLVDNALRHTPAGGEVRLSAAVADGRLRLSVADSGPGVAEALRTSLFEPFVTGRADGTGLGLAIARELAEAMGGTLRLAEDGPGAPSGATFVLEVPWQPC